MNDQNTGTFTASSQINFADHHEVQDNLNLLSPVQQNLFETAFWKSKQNRNQYSEQYFNNAAFIVASEPVYAHKYCRCGIPNIVNKSGRCSKRHFCPRCSYSKFLGHWKAFQSAFRQDAFWFCTFSYTGNVGFDVEGQDSCILHWNAIQHSLNRLLRTKTVSGGLASEELAVRSFLPTQVLPHLHCILTADVFDEDVVKLATEYVQEYRQSGEGVTMQPNVHAKLIRTYSEFEQEMRYMFKPIDIKLPYDSAWIDTGERDRAEASRLNSAMTDFLTGHTELTKGRMMIRRFGNMHASNKGFVGTKERKKKKRTSSGVFSMKRQ